MNEFMKKVLRRETHSPRSALSVFVAIFITGASTYAMLEMMLAGLGQPTWLLNPISSAQWLAELPGNYSPLLLGAAGVLIALVGLIFLGQGLLPGRRARHVIANPRVAVVVDDEVVASALAKRARMAAGVTREQVMVVVSAKTVQVNVRPTSGIRLSEAEIQAAVETELAAMDLQPTLAVGVNVADSGVIGV